MEGKHLTHFVLLVNVFNAGFAFPDHRPHNDSSIIFKPKDSNAFTLVVAYMSDAILPCRALELEVSNFRYKWYKDGNEILRPTIQGKDGTLWMQNATTEDSGIYYCHVFTNKGTTEATVTLIVLEAEKAPYFSKNVSFPHSASRRKTGSSVEFRCPVEGIPRPRVEWYKNNILIEKEQVSSSSDVNEMSSWTLVLENLTLNDSGNYSCVAVNKLGSVNATFKLEITDAVQPGLAVFHPLNTTVRYGSSATFQCRVRSEAPPNIQWLKQIEEFSSIKDVHDVMKVQGENYRVLPSSRLAKRSDGTFLNKLVIPEARETDSGKYICLGANKMGYSFRSAFLTVLPKSKSVNGWSHHVSVHPGSTRELHISFPTVGGGLGIALAMTVVAAFYFVCRRRSVSMNHVGRERTVKLLPATSIEMGSMSKDALSKSPLISATSPAQSEVELSGGVAVTKLQSFENGNVCYKLRDEV